ncbi:MAG TPA: beta-hydroxyacyl-ACP dehydratase [Nitrospirales bacterium]|nr:beta-hydroxyacyl-ACP dehydratase [Nitrospirales bacterium]
MNGDPIKTAIPHRGPMLLLDEIVEQTQDSIICRKTFRENEFFFQGHYPEFPIVPGVILCESAMQAGAVLLNSQLDGHRGIPVATRMNDVKFRKMVLPGDTVEIHVKLTERLADAFFLKAKTMSGSDVAVRFEFACTLAPRPDSPEKEMA